MSISDKNRDLILTLQEDPLASYVDISRSMNITPSTAKTRLSSLWSRENPDQIVMGVSGNLNPTSINLTSNTFLIEIDANAEQLKKFYDICEYHPYTAYQNRVYGSLNGFLVQFTSPKGSEDLLRELFTSVSGELGIKRIEQFSQSDSKFNTYPNISALKKDKWEFNFQDWFNKAKDFKENIEENQQNKEYQESSLELNHLIVARELMMNARRKQVDIMKDIQESEQYNEFEKKPFANSNQREVSRYFEFVNHQKIIDSYQLMFNREKFGLFNQICFIGEMQSETRNQFTSALKSPDNPIPFRVGVNFNKNKYFIYMDLPPPQSLEAMNFIYDLSSEMHMMVLESSLKHQRNYPLWHRNYLDNASGWKWNDTRDWIVDQPLSEVMN